MNKRFILIGILFIASMIYSGLDLTNHLNILKSLDTQINIAGKQRMLSQLIARHHLEARQNKRQDLKSIKTKIEKAGAQLKSNQYNIVQGSPELEIRRINNKKIKKQFNNVDIQIKDYIKRSLCYSTECSIDEFLLSSDKLLFQLNENVNIIEEHAHHKLVTFKHKIIFYLLLFFIFFLFIYFFIIKPQYLDYLQNNNKLRESNKVITQIFNNSPFGIIIVNEQMEIKLVNSALLKMLGMHDFNGINLKVNEAFKDYLLGNIEQMAYEILFDPNTKNRQDFYIRGHNKLKEDKKFKLHISYAENLFSIIISDITEQLQQERENEINSQMATMGILTSGLIHELKNPLNHLSLYWQTLLPTIEDEKTKQNIKSSFKRINRLINDISTYSKSCSSTSKDHIINLKQIALMAKTLTIVETKYNSEVIIEGEDVFIKANEGKITQVLINLIVNASQSFLRSNAENIISIHISSKDNRAQITIEDNGKGIETNHLKHIFDSFFTTKNHKNGTGLGLSITKRVVEEYDGNIYVESQLNKGTIFTIDFPEEYPVEKLKSS